MADQLLDTIIRQLLGPTLIVDSGRKVTFASDSLRRLLGRVSDLDHCENIVFAPRLRKCGGCCWDAIDDYLDCGSHALWPMRRADGTWISTICQLSVVDIAGAHGFVHMRVRPLARPLERDLVLFRAMRAGMPGRETYRHWAVEFFSKHGKAHLEWLDASDQTDRRVHAALDGIARIGTEAPFDIRVAEGKSSVVRRVIAARGAESLQLALLQSKGGRMMPGELMAAWAAVCVSAESDADRAIDAGPSAAGTDLLLEALSPRETEVLALVLEGLTDSAIAARLGLSVHTVKNHVRHIMEKCGVRKRVQLAAIARAA